MQGLGRTSHQQRRACYPLNHHFVCLTSMVLLELSKVENTRDEALKLLKEHIRQQQAAVLCSARRCDWR